jgi:glycosyltransferase involved in cell wall biosynthesis
MARIVLVNGSPEWGVGGRLHLELAEALQAREHAVTVIGRPGGPFTQRAGARRIPALETPFPCRPSLRAWGRMRALLDELGPDIVHACHLPDLWTLARPAGRRLPAGRIVFTLYLSPGRRARWWPWRQLRRHVAAYTAPTPLLQMVGARALGIPMERVEIISHFVDASRYTGEEMRGRAGQVRREWGVDPLQPVVGTMSPMRPHHGLTYFMEAAALAGPHLEARWLVIPFPGRRDPAFEARLRARLEGVPWAAIVPPGEDTGAVLNALDLFVFPTEREGYARSLLEAMAAGVPVVAVAGPGTGFVVEKERSGLLVRPRDPLAIAGAVAQVLSDPDLRQRLAQAGRQRVVNHFSPEVVLPRYEALYERLME